MIDPKGEPNVEPAAIVQAFQAEWPGDQIRVVRALELACAALVRSGERHHSSYFNQIRTLARNKSIDGQVIEKIIEKSLFLVSSAARPQAPSSTASLEAVSN